MKTNNTYFVLLGDVIDSSRQSGVQRVLHNAVKRINTEITDAWQTPFEITRGDEIAVIVNTACPWFTLLRKFNDLVRPMELRWVVIYDEIKEGLSTRSSAEAVGPAFIKADQLMRNLKKTDLYFDVEIGVDQLNDELRGVINLILWRLNDLSELQLNILRKYQLTRKQLQVAHALGKTQQQVQSSLKAIRWEIIDSAEKAADTLVAEINHKLRQQVETH